jgi:hypothetical protein
MRKESHSEKSTAIRLSQPGNMLSDKAHWFVRVEYALARVARWLEPADQMDYLIRRSLLRRVDRGVTASGRLIRASVGAGVYPCREQQLSGERSS